jgi:hypothetical protein
MLLCAPLKLAKYGSLRHTRVTEPSPCMRMAYGRRTPVLVLRDARKGAFEKLPPVSCSRRWFDVRHSFPNPHRVSSHPQIERVVTQPIVELRIDVEQHALCSFHDASAARCSFLISKPM